MNFSESAVVDPVEKDLRIELIQGICSFAKLLCKNNENEEQCNWCEVSRRRP